MTSKVKFQVVSPAEITKEKYIYGGVSNPTQNIKTSNDKEKKISK